MRTSLVYITFLTLILTYVFRFQVHAAPAAPVIKHLSSLLKWTTTRSSSKTPQSDENVLQFEDGYLVETVVEGNELGVMPYSIHVSQDGELYAVDAVNSNIVRITPPLSHYSRARLVAGSFQGYTGHVDGKANDARFNHPKGVTMDDKGNVYVADTSNLAIRKIGEAGVTTIAGGKSNVAGYRDGPSEDAKFSSDFDVIYVRPTCSLLVIDRGNAALRQIALNQEDCDDQNNSISATDVFMVVGAVITGYTICMLQQGFGSSFLSRMQQPMERESREHPSKGKTTPVVETIKVESEAGWPSFGQLLMDLSKLALEALASVFLQFMPFSFQRKSSTNGLTPLKDSLVMPEDVAEPPLVQKHRTPAPLSETRQAHTPNASDKYSEMKPPKMRSSSFKDPSLSSKHRSSKRQEYAEFYGPNEVTNGLTPLKDSLVMPEDVAEPPLVQKHRTPAPLSETRQAHTPNAGDKYSEMKPPKMRSSSFKDPSLSSKHRSSKRQEYAEFYGPNEVPLPVRSKSQKERTKHRQWDKGGEVGYGVVGAEHKPVEIKPVNFDEAKFGHYNIRSKYADSYRFD